MTATPFSARLTPPQPDTGQGAETVIAWRIAGRAIAGGDDRDVTLEFLLRPRAPDGPDPWTCAVRLAGHDERPGALEGATLRTDVATDASGDVHVRVLAGERVVLDAVLAMPGARVMYARTCLLRELGIRGGRYELLRSPNGANAD